MSERLHLHLPKVLFVCCDTSSKLHWSPSNLFGCMKCAHLYLDLSLFFLLLITEGFLNREKDKMRDREEAWCTVENMAGQNPMFDNYSDIYNNINSSEFDSSSPQDEDGEFNPDLNTDSKEVNIIGFIFKFYIIFI